MTYPVDRIDNSGPGGGEGSVSISSQISTALGAYVTSASVSAMVAGYLTSASANLAQYLTSASAASVYITSNSVSGMITTRLGPYLTSASANLGTYVTSASLATAFGTYVTSSSLSTALSPYLTSNSASSALAAKQATLVSGTNIKTINGSSVLGSGDLTVTGSGSAESSTFAISPGTAPVILKDRYYRWTPRDFHADAIPRSSVGTNTETTNTLNAINAMFAANVLCGFERGTYYVDNTVKVNATSNEATSVARKDVLFCDTTIKIRASMTDASVSASFAYCRSQDDGVSDINGLNSTGDNLPAGEHTPVLFDITNCAYSNFAGSLTLDGSDKLVAGIAGANEQGINGSTSGVTWGNVIVKNCRWGLFGTPRYNGTRSFYIGPFVGHIFQRLRLVDNTYHFLFGGNTCDDTFIGELNVIGKNVAGSVGLMDTAALVCGTIYMNGPDTSSYGIDLQSSHLKFGTCYAEDKFASPIICRADADVEGICKYGAGTGTDFGNQSFVHYPTTSGSGRITVHERGQSNTTNASKAIVSLAAVSGAKRNVWVHSPLAEADLTPFRAVGGAVQPTGDNLVAVTRDGFAKWNWTSSSNIARYDSYVTSASASAQISTALGGAYTATASLAAVTVAGRPVGSVLLGYQTISNVNNFSFSGSWSDFCVLQLSAAYRIETGTSATASAAVYTDGGTTPFLGLGSVSSTQSAGQLITVELAVYGGDGRANKLLRVDTAKATNLITMAATATANTGFVNAIKYFTSATMTAGMAALFGWRKA
jgi:hypothetical protein